MLILFTGHLYMAVISAAGMAVGDINHDDLPDVVIASPNYGLVILYHTHPPVPTATSTLVSTPTFTPSYTPTITETSTYTFTPTPSPTVDIINTPSRNSNYNPN